MSKHNSMADILQHQVDRKRSGEMSYKDIFNAIHRNGSDDERRAAHLAIRDFEDSGEIMQFKLYEHEIIIFESGF